LNTPRRFLFALTVLTTRSEHLSLLHPLLRGTFECSSPTVPPRSLIVEIGLLDLKLLRLAI